MTLILNMASTGLLALIDRIKAGDNYVKVPRGEKGKKGKGEDGGDVVIRYGRPDPNDAKIQGADYLKDRKKDKKKKDK